MSKYLMSAVYSDKESFIRFTRDFMKVEGKITKQSIEHFEEHLEKLYGVNAVVTIGIAKVHDDSFFKRIKSSIKKHMIKRQFKKAMKAEFNVKNEKDGEEIEGLS